jgi:hypothetical protein
VNDVALFLGCLGLLFSIVAVIATIVDRRNRRRT